MSKSKWIPFLYKPNPTLDCYTRWEEKGLHVARFDGRTIGYARSLGDAEAMIRQWRESRPEIYSRPARA